MSNEKSSRREFIKTGLFLGAGALLPGSLALTKMVQSGNSDDRRIIIIGAGLAGLACAYDLGLAGFNIILLEARSRPGGRVRTYRDPFADGLYAEMGAEYVNSEDRYVHKYAKEFGLSILTAKLYDGIYLRGKKFRMKDFHGKPGTPFSLTVSQGYHFVPFFLGNRLHGQAHSPANQQHRFQSGILLDFLKCDRAGEFLIGLDIHHQPY